MLFKKNLLQAAMFTATLFNLSACTDNAKVADTKKEAEQSNEANTNIMSKEKDAQFLVLANEINMEEIALGKLAQQKSNNASVKNLGKSLETAHTQSSTALATLAAQKTMNVPKTATEKVLAAEKKLGETNNANFDKTYTKMMVDGYKNAVALFEKAATECNDPDIKAWATSMLPELRTHLDMATMTYDKVVKMK